MGFNSGFKGLMWPTVVLNGNRNSLATVAAVKEYTRLLTLYSVTQYTDFTKVLCVISGFLLETNENCHLLSFYAAIHGNTLPTFRDNLSVPSSYSRLGPIGCPETSIRDYHCALRNTKISHFCSCQRVLYFKNVTLIRG